MEPSNIHYGNIILIVDYVESGLALHLISIQMYEWNIEEDNQTCKITISFFGIYLDENLNLSLLGEHQFYPPCISLELFE